MNNEVGKVFLNVEGEMHWDVTGTDLRYMEQLTALLPLDVAAGVKSPKLFLCAVQQLFPSSSNQNLTSERFYLLDFSDNLLQKS